MSQIPAESDDNRSVAASDFVQLDQSDEVPDHHEEQPQFGLHQSLDWTMDMGSTRNYDNELKEHKLMIEKLEAKIETLQSNMKNLELEAKIRALEEKAEQKANYQALEAKMNDVAQILSTQNKEHHKEMNQLKDGFTKEMAQLKDGFAKEMAQFEQAKNQKEEKLMSNVGVQTTNNGALDAKMEQLQDEFSKILAEQQKQKMATAQFQAQSHSLEQKLKEAEQRAQTWKNELEEIIRQKMEKFREEMDKNGQQHPIDGNLKKLDFMWSQLMAKSKILANPKGIVWNRSKTQASISECELTATNTGFKWVFAIATEGYAISVEHCRKENSQFPGTIIFYYEVTLSSFGYSSVGFTDGSKPPAAGCVGGSPNSYGIAGPDFANKKHICWLSEKKHKLECPNGPIARGDVFGSGLMLNSKNELAVFFTVDGILLVKQTTINPTVDRLYPTVSFYCASMDANFGDNLVAKPFKFDTDKCPGLVFE